MAAATLHPGGLLTWAALPLPAAAWARLRLAAAAALALLLLQLPMRRPPCRTTCTAPATFGQMTSQIREQHRRRQRQRGRHQQQRQHQCQLRQRQRSSPQVPLLRCRRHCRRRLHSQQRRPLQAVSCQSSQALVASVLQALCRQQQTQQI